MNRQQRRHPPKTAPQPKMSVMQALETAVLLLEQAGETEEDIMKYVHLIHLGLIRDGQFTPEYVELAQRAMEERRQLEDERLRAEQVQIIDTRGNKLT